MNIGISFILRVFYWVGKTFSTMRRNVEDTIPPLSFYAICSTTLVIISVVDKSIKMEMIYRVYGNWIWVEKKFIP